MAAGGFTFLLFIFITHFFAINGAPPPPPSCLPPLSPPSGGFENELLEANYKVIQAFKKKVTSDPKNITKTWVGKDICNYRGFFCDIVPYAQKKTIAGVNFNGFNIAGPITDFIAGLKDIAFFHANSNGLTGVIPNNITKHPYLFELDLSNNKFSGRFPTAVLGATRLVFLDLRFNNFYGKVPPEVFQLDVDLLFINNNKFVQPLPLTVGFTPAMYLTLANNHFVGKIPTTIGSAYDTLLEVLFLNNRLTGCLPYQIGFLKKATVLDVGGNNLTGSIPRTFKCLEKMELLNLAQNRFSDSVPEAVCSLPALSNFTLSYNYFNKVGPLCRKLIKSGVLDMKMNCISDLPNQRSPAECRKFYSLPRASCQMSFKDIPCRKGNTLESSDLEFKAPAPAPARRGQTYGALSPP